MNGSRSLQRALDLTANLIAEYQQYSGGDGGGGAAAASSSSSSSADDEDEEAGSRPITSVYRWLLIHRVPGTQLRSVVHSLVFFIPARLV